jgi:hypothetical protein
MRSARLARIRARIDPAHSVCSGLAAEFDVGMQIVACHDKNKGTPSFDRATRQDKPRVDRHMFAQWYSAGRETGRSGRFPALNLSQQAEHRRDIITGFRTVKKERRW